jgi:hypothetical protein
METRLQLRYSGKDVDQGRMDVYAASQNMVAFSEFMVAAVKATYGPQAEARAEVSGYGKGSFITDICFTVGGPLATLFSSVAAPEQLFDVIKEAFALWKHLRGAPPEKVEQNEQKISVTNNNGQIIQIKAETFNLVMSDKGGDTVSRFVGAALNGAGIDSVSVQLPENKSKNEIVSVKKSEAPYFKPVDIEKPVTENVGEYALIIESAVFKDGNKWKFSDGSSSFSADIEDQNFLKRVEDGERFGKGDVLRVEMRIKQSSIGVKLAVERAIIKVIDHQDRKQQTVMPF